MGPSSQLALPGADSAPTDLFSRISAEQGKAELKPKDKFEWVGGWGGLTGKSKSDAKKEKTPEEQLAQDTSRAEMQQSVREEARPGELAHEEAKFNLREEAAERAHPAQLRRDAEKEKERQRIIASYRPQTKSQTA